MHGKLCISELHYIDSVDWLLDLDWVSVIQEEGDQLVEDRRSTTAHGAYDHWNPKRHIPMASLLLQRKMVTVLCFVWALGLQLWSVRQKGSETKFQHLTILKKILYLATSKRFHVFKAVFHVRCTNIIQ